MPPWMLQWNSDPETQSVASSELLNVIAKDPQAVLRAVEKA